MKVKGFKKGANMNFSNASGNGERVDFTLSNGTEVTFTLDAQKTFIEFSDEAVDRTVFLYVDDVLQMINGGGKNFVSAPIDTESTIQISGDFKDGTVGGSFGEGFIDLITALGDSFATAFTPSRISITDCADRVTFQLLNLDSFYAELNTLAEGNSNNILHPQYPEFLNYYFNVSAELIGGGSYTLPLSGDQVIVNSNGDRALFVGANQSAYTDVENVSEVGFGEDFNGTFTVNITTADGQLVVSETITDPNYTCDIATPVDDSGKDGCTDSTALNYDPAANNNDGSCIYKEEEEEVVNPKYGCTDSSATNFDPAATNDDGSCTYYEAPENEYLADVSGLTAVLGLTNENYGNIIDDTIYLIQQLQTELENCPEDQTAQVAQLTQELDTANQQLEELQGADAMLNAVQDTIDNIAEAPCSLADPETQATFTALKQANVGVDTIEALRVLCKGNDNITIEDVNAANNDLNLALGVIQDILGNAVPDSTTSVVVANLVTLENDIQAAIDALQANQEDGISQSDLTAAENDYNTALDNLEAAYDADLEAGLSTAESDYNTALDALDAEYDASLAALEADQTTALDNLSETQAAALSAAEDAYNIALNLQAGQLGDINEGLQTQINALEAQVPLDAAAAAAAQQTALVNLQAEFDALGLVYTEQEMIDLIQAAEDGITPEDGVTAETVLAAEAVLQAIIDTMFTQEQLDDAALAATTAAELAASQAAAALAAITAQNIADANAAYDEALSAAQDASFQEGAASVDITTDNAEAIADAMALLSAGDEVYDAIFGEGADSITPEDGISQSDVDEVEALLDAANTAIASGDTGAAYDTLMGELEEAQNQLADATATNDSYEIFIKGVDTSMSRLERFLTDSYSYEAYDRGSLVIPANMESENPNFENQTPSMTSIYVGDGTDFGNTSTYNDNLASQFGEFSGGRKKAKSHSNFAYMMGKANHMREGFMNYSGELPFSRMDGNDDDSNEEGFELTKGTKTGLWIFGGAVAAFGLYKVLKKK